MKTETALAARGIKKHYGRRLVLDVPELSVPARTTFALLGSSGAGKSTLLRILGLLERPDAGRVLLDDREASPRDREARMRMAMLFQKPYLFSGTVGDNVAYGLKARKVPSAERERRVGEALERVGLGGFGERDHRALSGGEAQRVALARALVVAPDVLLLDEPLSFIDPLVKDRLTREFAAVLREEGVTAVWVTHDQEEAFAVADAVGILHEGRFVASGSLDEVMTEPSSAWTAGFLGMEPPIPGRVSGRDDGVAEVDVGEGRILYGASDLPVGSSALVAIRPEDVTLFSAGEQLPKSSARNHVDGVVVDVRPKGAMMRVVISFGPHRIASLVSRASISELRLSEGTPVAATFKAAATRIVAAERHG